MSPANFFVTQPISTENSELKIFVTTSITKRPLTLLVDSGAQISLLRGDTIISDTIFYPKQKINIKGISGTEPCLTLGLAFGTVYVNKIGFKHHFQIFNNTMNLNTDGLLGCDFLLRYGCQINLQKNIFKVPIPLDHEIFEPHKREEAIQFFDKKLDTKQTCESNPVPSGSNQNPVPPGSSSVPSGLPQSPVLSGILNIPVPSGQSVKQITENLQDVHKKYQVHGADEIELISSHQLPNDYFTNNHIQTLPASTQTCLLVRIPSNRELICKKTEIKPGVYIGDTIVQSTNGYANVAVINFNEVAITISNENLKLQFDSLQDYFTINSITQNKHSKIRTEELIAKLNLAHCSQTEKQIVKQICADYHDLFHLDDDLLTHTDIVQHEIDLIPGTSPIFVKQYRIPEGNRKEVNRQIDELEKNGIIEPSNSPWNFPILLVPKKENSKGEKQYRLVVDFRRLNEVTVNQSFPIPLIDEILDLLGKSSIFTTLDVQGAFHQIMVRPEDRELLSFQSGHRKMQFVRMPFGLINSPRTWQRAINAVLTNLLGIGVMVYLDDILIFNKTVSEHETGIRAVLDRLRCYNIKLKADKCTFFGKQVNYLGYVINAEGIQPDPKKTECVNTYPRPKTKVEVQRFLGMANYYRRFIKNFSGIAKPMHALCRNDRKFIWDGSCEDAFITLKNKLTQPPVMLAHPDFSKQFILATDASNVVISAVISQKLVSNIDQPIQFASRLLRKSELNYSTIEKELLAIIFGVKVFRHYLYASTIEFLIITDHRPLVYLMNLKDVSSRLFRWKLLMSEFNFKIIYRAGSLNKVADALSRIDTPEAKILKVNLYHEEKPMTLIQLLTTTYEANNLIFQSETLSNIPVCTINQVTTRQKHKEMQQAKAIEELNKLQLNTPNTAHKNDPKPDNYYHIEENNNVLIQKGDFDHIFYIFDSLNCEILKKLKQKLQNELQLPETINPYTSHSLDEDRTFFLLPNIYRNPEQLEKAEIVLKEILEISTTNLFENIAVNIDIPDARSYFEFKLLFKKLFENSNIETTFFLNKVIELTDINDIQKVLDTYHKSLLGGHAGLSRTQNRIRKYFHWPTMRKDIKDYIKNCSACELSKIKRHTKSPMQITSVASRPFEKLFIDLIGPITPPSQSGNNYILTCNDDLSKFGIAVPMNSCSAFETSKAFVEEVVLKFALPLHVVSDNGSNLASSLFSEVNKLLGISRSFTTPYHPQSNAVERFHKSLGQFMRTYVKQDPDNWDHFIAYAVHSYNNTPHSTTGYAPQELLFGFSNPLPVNITKSITPTYNYESYVSELKFRLQQSYKIAREKLMERKIKNKQLYDKNMHPLELEIDDPVNLLRYDKTSKFQQPYEPGWRVWEIINPVTVKIKKGNKIKKVHKDRLIKSYANQK